MAYNVILYMCQKHFASPKYMPHNNVRPDSPSHCCCTYYTRASHKHTFSTIYIYEHNKQHTQRSTQSTRNVKIRKLIYDIRLTRLSVSFRSATYTESIVVVVVAMVDVARQRKIIVIFWTAICAMRTRNTELSAYQSTTRNRQATLNFSIAVHYLITYEL